MVDGAAIIPEGTEDPMAARRLLERDGAVIVAAGAVDAEASSPPIGTQDHRDTGRVLRWLLGEDLTAAARPAAVRDGATADLARATSDLAMPLHVDGFALGDAAPDVVALTCAVPAADGGGRSLVVDAVAAVAALEHDPLTEVLHHLATEQLVDLSERGQPPRAGTVLAAGPRRRSRVWLSLDLRPLPDDPDPERTSARLEAWRRWWADLAAATPTFSLAAGETLVLDNCRMAHGRTAHADRDRLLWRTWAWSATGPAPPPGPLVSDTRHAVAEGAAGAS